MNGFMHQQVAELGIAGIAVKRHVNHAVAEAVGHAERSAGIGVFAQAFEEAVVFDPCKDEDQRLSAKDVLCFFHAEHFHELAMHPVEQSRITADVVFRNVGIKQETFAFAQMKRMF